MIHLQTGLIWPGCAQGKYIIKAKGCMLAVLRWGREKEPLAGWGPFAYVPIDPAGNGCFFFSGKRGIPKEATHVWARCILSGSIVYSLCDFVRLLALRLNIAKRLESWYH